MAFLRLEARADLLLIRGKDSTLLHTFGISAMRLKASFHPHLFNLHRSRLAVRISASSFSAWNPKHSLAEEGERLGGNAFQRTTDPMLFDLLFCYGMEHIDLAACHLNFVTYRSQPESLDAHLRGNRSFTRGGLVVYIKMASNGTHATIQSAFWMWYECLGQSACSSRFLSIEGPQPGFLNAYSPAPSFRREWFLPIWSGWHPDDAGSLHVPEFRTPRTCLDRSFDR